MILGCDAAGVDEQTGRRSSSIRSSPAMDWTGDETLDTRRTLLSEKYQGTMAEHVTVPTGNVIPKPAELTFAEAACLSTSWLTAYRMLFVNSGLRPGQTVLVQGAGGGVASALIALARAAGYRVWCTSRSPEKRRPPAGSARMRPFDTGARLPERVEAVIETVGAATWSHSLKALKPGGRVVVSGATSGPNPPAELNRIFFLQLSVIGSTMGTRSELADLIAFLLAAGVRPTIDRTLPLDRIAEGLAALESGDVVGKIVIEP